MEIHEKKRNPPKTLQKCRNPDWFNSKCENSWEILNSLPPPQSVLKIGRSEQPQPWLGRDGHATDRIVQDHPKSFFFLDDPKAQ